MKENRETRHRTYRIEIKGLVQGVGFRPFIYRLALENNLWGSVENRNDGVVVLLNCSDGQLSDFVHQVQTRAPLASKIESIRFEKIGKMQFSGFDIVKSTSVSATITDVSPDIAVCPDCLEDMKTQVNRIDYPFVNCTNCGPRFTIIQDLPYDREKTTMKEFVMCASCRSEYTDILDRRFHAQPVACALCGPAYRLHIDGEEISDQRLVLEKTIQLLKSKQIVAIKGLGGFFIACDAFCEQSVARLRELKSREGKPFAVMFSDIDSLRQYAHLEDAEEKALLSFKRPVVLLQEKAKLAESVNVGFDTIGAMLPYMPLHHLLFEKSGITAIVLTSGNISDEPIITDDRQAVDILGKICDAVLTYNRDIHNRADDSVVRIMNGRECVLRRSRGYVPVPVKLDTDVDGLLATGAELANCFCIGKDDQAILSQHIGDLKNLETWTFFAATIEKYKQLFRFEPRHIVADMHPDYLSTRYAIDSGLPVSHVQHHHAHIASCMAEHGLNERVIGVAFDGTGYGDDGNIWGGEFLVCDFKGYRRITHFDYMPVPGGDMVTHEPWRMALSYLYRIYGDGLFDLDLPMLQHIDTDKASMLCRAIDAEINCPLSSSAGRLFDAVSALVGLCVESRFHAEAPMRLESVIDKGEKAAYPFEYKDTINFLPAVEQIVKDVQKKQPVATISTRFHNTVVEAAQVAADQVRLQHGINKVVLSGGAFQNRYLATQLENKLTQAGFNVFSQAKIPMNDGGIALGQLLIGAEKMRR